MLSYLPSILGLLGVIGFRVTQKEWPTFRNDIFKISAIFIGFLAISLLWTINQEETIKRILKVGLILLGSGLLFSLLQSMPKDFAKNLRPYFRYSLIAVALALIFETFTQGGLFLKLHEENPLWSSSFLNSSSVLAFLITLPFVLTDIKNKQSWIIIGLFAITLACTESQTIHLGLIIALATLCTPTSKKLFWNGLIICIPALILTAPWIAQWGYDTLAPMLDGKDWFSDAYASMRIEIWDFVSRRALEKPILGHGIEATRLIKDFETAYAFYPKNTVLHPHNFAIQIWIEFGAIGAILTSLFATYTLYTLKAVATHDPKQAKIALSIFLTMLGMAATSYGLWQGWWLGTLLFSAILTHLFVFKKET